MHGRKLCPRAFIAELNSVLPLLDYDTKLPPGMTGLVDGGNYDLIDVHAFCCELVIILLIETYTVSILRIAYPRLHDILYI